MAELAMNSVGGQARPAAQWDEYLRWNDAIANVVYGSHAAGQPVYLDPEEPVLRAAAEAVGGVDGDPRDALLRAVRPTLNSPAHARGIFGGHVARLKRWRRETGEPPPVIGLLAVFCLAAEDMRQGDGFSSNNYYDRLMPLLGVTSEADKKRVVRSYRAISFELWESLNGWLESLHGERGLPTAYAYSHVHVGRPLSQALIRSADRAKLEEFFAELGVEQRARLSPGDLEPLLAAWITRSPSPASHQLQALWKRPGARERIAEIASQLLETWQPPRDSEVSIHRPAREGGRRSTLRLLALMRTFPTAALELNLIGPVGDDGAVARLMDATDGSDLGIDLALDGLPDRRWRLSQPEELESRSLIEAAIRLRFASGVTLDRRPRRVVPLKRDDLLQSFVEVERLGLGEDGMILCTSGLGHVVEDALGKIARPGFRHVEPPPPGCPPDWTLFTRVQVLAPLHSVSPASGTDWPLDLDVLQPLATSQLVVQGGLQLPGPVRRWSSRAAPEIRAAAEDADRVRVTIDRVGAFQDTTRVLDSAADQPLLVVDLKAVNLDDGDYDITATATSNRSKPRPLGTTRLRLRSGSVASAVRRNDPPLARPVDARGLGVLFATPWDGAALVVRGARVLPRAPEPLLRPEDVGAPPWWQRRHDPAARTEASDAGVLRPSVSMASATDCFQSGAHFLQLPTFYGKATTAFVEGVCKYCGLVKRFPSSYHRIGRKRRSGAQEPPRQPTFRVSEASPVSSEDGVTADIALDALTHDLAGPASWLEQVALQVEASRLFVDRFVRALDALAHIELSRDPSSLVAVSWEALPPSLVELPAGGFILCGRRSRRLEAALDDAAARTGVSIERADQGRLAPTRVLLAGTLSDARAVAERVSEIAGDEISVVTGSAEQIAASLPPLAPVIDSLPRQAMVGARSIRRWFPDLARWRSVGDASLPGAYQMLSPSPIYCLRDALDIENGTMRRVDARFAKYAGALVEGERTIGYDEATQTLYVPLGADLPGLYARAAVLCSGLLPIEDEHQRLTRYQQVPRRVAEHLATLLDSTPETPR